MLARTKAKPIDFVEGHPNSLNEAIIDAGGSRAESVLWDFSEDGGAVGTIRFDRWLPAGALITRVWFNELTATTGATDIVLKAGSTALTGSLDFDGAQATGVSSDDTKIPVYLSAEAELNIVITTAAATAGKIRFHVEYLIQNDTET